MNLFRRSPKSEADVAREQEKQAIKQQKAQEKEAKKQHKAIEKVEQKQVKRELKQLKNALAEQTKQQKLEEAQVKKAEKLRLKQLEAETKEQRKVAKKADALRKKQEKALKREGRRQEKQWQREHRVEAKAQKKAVRAERKRRKKLMKQRKRSSTRRPTCDPLVEEVIPVDPIAVDGSPVLPRSKAPAFKESSNCATCRVAFQRMSKRSRHHCRNCGESCCKKCLSKVKHAMPWYNIFKPQKICLVCESIVFTRRSPAAAALPGAESQPVGQSTASSPHAVRAPPASAPPAMHPSSAARPRPMSAPVSLDSRRPNTLRRGGSSKGKKSSIWNLPIRPMLKRKESVQQLRNRTLDYQLEKSHQLAKASREVLIPRSVELAPQYAYAPRKDHEASPGATEDSMDLGPIGSFVLERWRSDWFMGRIVALEPEANESGGRVLIHVHGEPDTTDKWFPCDSPNLTPLVVLQSPQTAVGTFPARGDLVQLLVMDRTLYVQIQGDEEVTLNGRVVNVLPARDASVVLVQHPMRAGSQERRLQINNGYLRVVSEPAFLDSEQRLAASIKSSEVSSIDTSD